LHLDANHIRSQFEVGLVRRVFLLFPFDGRQKKDRFPRPVSNGRLSENSISAPASARIL